NLVAAPELDNRFFASEFGSKRPNLIEATLVSNRNAAHQDLGLWPSVSSAYRVNWLDPSLEGTSPPQQGFLLSPDQIKACIHSEEENRGFLRIGRNIQAVPNQPLDHNVVAKVPQLVKF